MSRGPAYRVSSVGMPDWDAVDRWAAYELYRQAMDDDNDCADWDEHLAEAMDPDDMEDAAA